VEIHVSIVIPHHNDESCLEVLLASMQNQKTDLKIETVIISNPPSLKAEKIAIKYKNTKHYQLSQVGVNRARNYGINESQGNLIFFCDSDCEMTDPDLIQKHWDHHRTNPDATFIGGVYSQTSAKAIDRAYHFNQMLWLCRGTREGTSSFLIGGHFSAKRGLIEALRFDEIMTFGGTETEYFYRLGALGRKSKLLPDLQIQHNSRLNGSQLTRKIYRQGFGARYIEEKLKIAIRNDHTNFATVDFISQNLDDSLNYYLGLIDRVFQEGYSSKLSRCTYRQALMLNLKYKFNYRVDQLFRFCKDLFFLLKIFPK